MTKIMNTKLLGNEFSEAGIPHENIDGELHIENNGISFWSGKKHMLFMPLSNINNYGTGCTRLSGALESARGLVSSYLTFFLIDSSQVYFVWIIYYDENYRRNMKVCFQTGRVFKNDFLDNKVIDSIANAIREDGQKIRQATRPQKRK